MHPVIDVHTHMYTREWLDLLRLHGGPDLTVAESLDSPETVFYKGASFCVLEAPHFDFDLRIRNMNEAGVDVAIITVSCPSVFWGDEDSSSRAAVAVNDAFAAAQTAWPDRIRWMASLPWEYPERAVAELDRACRLGAVAVVTLGNINGRHLTDPLFEPVWDAIDARGLPVLVHPSYPPGADALELSQYAMIASVGFMVDTSVAVVRLICDGFLDRYPRLKLIASHGGATLPYLCGRLDRVFERTKRARVKISRPPSEYLRHIYYDSVVYRQEALELCVQVGGDTQVMYGSDYPFNLGDMRGCLARVDALPAAVRDQVRGANAARIFGL